MTIAYKRASFSDPSWNPLLVGAPVRGSSNNLPRVFFDGTNTQTLSNAAAVFAAAEREWKDETAFVSNPAQKFLHPAYARIIGLGRPAIPLILRSMMKEPSDWFYALRALTGENPVPDQMAGDMVAMTATWILWGRSRALI